MKIKMNYYNYSIEVMSERKKKKNNFGGILYNKN